MTIQLVRGGKACGSRWTWERFWQAINSCQVGGRVGTWPSNGQIPQHVSILGVVGRMDTALSFFHFRTRRWDAGRRYSLEAESDMDYRNQRDSAQWHETWDQIISASARGTRSVWALRSTRDLATPWTHTSTRKTNVKVPYNTRVRAPAITLPNAAARSTRACATLTDDSAPLNPVGRGTPEGSRGTEKLTCCKKSILIATMNVRTLRINNKRLELANAFNEQLLDVLGVVDYKIVHSDSVNIQKMNKCTLITTSAWRTVSNAASGGVGIMINALAEKALSNVSSYNDNKRILVANFSGNPATTIIVHRRWRVLIKQRITMKICLVPSVKFPNTMSC